MANIIYICIIAIVIIFGIIKEVKKMQNESLNSKNEIRGIRGFAPVDKSIYRTIKEIKWGSLKINFIKKIFASKETKAALGVLDEASYLFDSEAFQLLRSHVEKMILSHNKEFVDFIRKGMSPREWVYTAIANTSRDLVESGEYHIYRGLLNDMGHGYDLLKIFDGGHCHLISYLISCSFRAFFRSERPRYRRFLVLSLLHEKRMAISSIVRFSKYNLTTLRRDSNRDSTVSLKIFFKFLS